MFQRVSVLIPTRGRVERLRILLASYGETTLGCRNASELVFKVDDDDPATYDFLRGQPEHRVIVGPRMNGYASMGDFFNELAVFARGDVLMCGNDDMVFRSHGWAPSLLRTADAYPDGLFDLGVTTHNQEHYPFSTVSAKAVKAMGYLWHPTIFWGDIFLRDVMQQFGRALMVPSVRIDHDWAGNNPDQTFREGQAKGNLGPRESNYWTEVHPRAVNEAVGKLEKLQERAR